MIHTVHHITTKNFHLQDITTYALSDHLLA